MPQLILTIAPTPDGKVALWVSLRDADGAPLGPAREVVLNNRLAGFATDMQMFARQQLAANESLAGGRSPDGDEAIAVEAAQGE